MACQLSLLLDAVADRLDAAGDAGTFVKAIEANGLVWSEIDRVAKALGWPIPQRLVEFSTAAVARARQGLNDDEVETLIHMNRRMSRDIAALAGGPAPSGTTLWNQWMERRLCAARQA